MIVLKNAPPSLYEQYCCVKSNLGETIILTGEHKYVHISCVHLNCLLLVSLLDYISFLFRHILKTDPTAPSGYYNIRQSNGTITTVYCDMDLNCNGDERLDESGLPQYD